MSQKIAPETESAEITERQAQFYLAAEREMLRAQERLQIIAGTIMAGLDVSEPVNVVGCKLSPPRLLYRPAE